MAQQSLRHQEPPEKDSAEIESEPIGTDSIGQSIDQAIAELQQMRGQIHRHEEDLENRLEGATREHQDIREALAQIPVQSEKVLQSTRSRIVEATHGLDQVGQEAETALRTLESQSRQEEADWQRILEEKDRELSELESRLHELQIALEQKTSEQEEKHEELLRLQELIGNREHQERTLTQRIEELNTHLGQITGDRDRLVDENQRVRNQLEEAQQSHQSIANRLTDRECDFEQLQQRLADTQEELKNSRSENSNLVHEMEATRAKPVEPSEAGSHTHPETMQLRAECDRLEAECRRLANIIECKTNGSPEQAQSQEAATSFTAPPQEVSGPAIDRNFEPAPVDPVSNSPEFFPGEDPTLQPLKTSQHLLETERDQALEQNEQITQLLKATSGERDRLVSKIGGFEKDLEGFTEENEQLRSRLQQRTRELDELQRTSTELLTRSRRSEIAHTYEKQVANLEGEKREQTQRIEAARGENTQVKNERDEIARDLAASKSTLLEVLRKKIDLEIRVRKYQGQQEHFQEMESRVTSMSRGQSLALARSKTLNAVLAKTVQRKKDLEQELLVLRRELEARTEVLQKNTAGVDDLQNKVQTLRKERREATQRMHVLEKRVGEKFPGIAEAAQIGQEVIEGDRIKKLLYTFDFLWNPRQGYPFLDVESLRAIVRRIGEGLQRDPAGVLDLTDYHGQGYLKGHSLNVAKLSVHLGMHMELQNSTLEVLGIAALLHDLGMVEVPQAILEKSGRLVDAEWKAIHRHPSQGAALFREMELEGDLPAQIVSRVICEHHERTDGSGYPEGKRGDEIHQFARIVAVTDSFDAMTSRRSHRDAILPHDAIRTLIADAKKGLYDESVVEAFVQAMSLYPIGSFVQLSSGEIGKVVATGKEEVDRPVVRLTENEDGVALLQPSYVNLTEERGLSIERAFDLRSARY